MGYGFALRPRPALDEFRDGQHMTQPVGAPAPMLPPQGPTSWMRSDGAGNIQQGGGWTNGGGQGPLVNPPVEAAPQGGNATQPVGPPTPMMGGGVPPFPPQRPQLPGIKTTPQGGGMSLYGLGMPGAAPVSWLSPPQARQNAGPWNPFQGGFSGMVRG